MPKIGLTKSEWRERLSLFAQGNFKFGKGQRPPRGSDRARELERVEKCPKHSNTMQIDPFGRKIQCLCGYHQQQVSQMQSKIKSIALYALFFHTLMFIISVQSVTSLSSPGAQISSSSSSTAQPAATISLAGHSATAGLTGSSTHIQVSYTHV